MLEETSGKFVVQFLPCLASGANHGWPRQRGTHTIRTKRPAYVLGPRAGPREMGGTNTAPHCSIYCAHTICVHGGTRATNIQRPPHAQRAHTPPPRRSSTILRRVCEVEHAWGKRCVSLQAQEEDRRRARRRCPGPGQQYCACASGAVEVVQLVRRCGCVAGRPLGPCEKLYTVRHRLPVPCPARLCARPVIGSATVVLIRGSPRRQQVKSSQVKSSQVKSSAGLTDGIWTEIEQSD
jgi:hypothetical protein